MPTLPNCGPLTWRFCERCPGVRWVGRYGPEFKIHRALGGGKGETGGGEAEIEVTVLLQPRASALERGEVRGQFTRLVQESHLRFGSVYRGRLAQAKLEALANSEAVLWIEPAPRMKLFDEVSSKLVAGDGGPGRLLAQELGFDGAGVAVAVADSGLHNGDAATMHPDLVGRTPRFFHYGPNLLDAADEHSHGTHVAGIIAGNGATGEMDDNGALYGLGVAPGRGNYRAADFRRRWRL